MHGTMETADGQRTGASVHLESPKTLQSVSYGPHFLDRIRYDIARNDLFHINMRGNSLKWKYHAVP